MNSLRFNLFKHKLLVKIIDSFLYSFNDDEPELIRDYLKKIPFLIPDEIYEIIGVKNHVNPYIMSAINELDMDMRITKNTFDREQQQEIEWKNERRYKPKLNIYNLIFNKLIKDKELIDRRISVMKKILKNIVFYTLKINGITEDFLNSFEKYRIDIYGFNKIKLTYLYGYTNSLLTDLITRNFWRIANIYSPRKVVFDPNNDIILLTIKLYPLFNRKLKYIRLISRNLVDKFSSLENLKDSCICNSDHSYNQPDIILQELRYMISNDIELYGTIYGKIEYKLYEYSRGLTYPRFIKDVELSKFINEVITKQPMPSI